MGKAAIKELFDWVISIVVAVVLVVAIRTFIFTPIGVNGESMMPTYEHGDKVMVNKLSDSVEKIDRQDVIVFEAPTGENFIKRVIGLPGDTIAYENDVLYINGEAVEEPYLQAYKQQSTQSLPLTYDFTLQDVTGETTVPDDVLFVLGDNRQRSDDSRNPLVGFVPIENVLGKTTIRYYPLNSFGIVK